MKALPIFCADAVTAGGPPGGGVVLGEGFPDINLIYYSISIIIILTVIYKMTKHKHFYTNQARYETYTLIVHYYCNLISMMNLIGK